MLCNKNSGSHTKAAILGSILLCCIGGCAIGPKLIERCRNGNGPACYKLGECFEKGKCGLPSNAERAQRAYKSACESFYDPGCERLDSTSRDEAKQQEHFVSRAEQECKAGGAAPCVLLGEFYERSDPKHSRIHYGQACKAGVSQACQSADRLAQGLCERQGSGSDCMAFGLSLWEGRNGSRNRGLGILFIRRGCDIGEKQACEMLLRIQGE